MNKLLDFLIVFFSAVIAFSIGVIVAFHPSTKEITNKKYVEIEEPADKKKNTKGLEESFSYQPEGETSQQENSNLEKQIASSFKRIKEGIVYHPALILKVRGTKEGTEVHLLTLSTMEWPFVRTFLSEDTVLEKPEKVYLCKNGVVDVIYTLKGIWPPEVRRGKLEGKGTFVTADEKGELNFNDFNGNCSENGFVFTQKGEFAGVCFGSKFIDAIELYRTIPFDCQIIYPKEEGKDANLQSQNG